LNLDPKERIDEIFDKNNNVISMDIETPNWHGPWFYRRQTEHDQYQDYFLTSQSRLIGKFDNSKADEAALKEAITKEGGLYVENKSYQVTFNDLYMYPDVYLDWAINVLHYNNDGTPVITKLFRNILEKSVK
jgi:hypothetical protein